MIGYCLQSCFLVTSFTMLLLLCSQTVRVYSGDTLELQQVLSASGLIHGWFTLTYLKFCEQVNVGGV